jgi:hypothetical protein
LNLSEVLMLLLKEIQERPADYGCTHQSLAVMREIICEVVLWLLSAVVQPQIEKLRVN